MTVFQAAIRLVMLSYSFWQTRFASNRSIVGKTLVINGRNMTVIGVAQRGFEGVELGRASKIFIPIMMKAQITPFWDAMKDRRWRWVNAFGRLKPGISLQQAKASLQPFMHSMLEMEVKEAAFSKASSYTKQQFLKSWMDVLPGSQGRSYLRQQLSTPLWMLQAITAAVLLLACANLANLLLARATARQREVAIRLAIGAGRGRIIRQLLVESLLLSGFGAVVGLALAFWADRFLLGVYLPAEPGALTISAVPDFRILGFTICVMVVTALIFGLAPALQSSRSEAGQTLKNEAGSVVGGGGAGIAQAPGCGPDHALASSAHRRRIVLANADELAKPGTGLFVRAAGWVQCRSILEWLHQRSGESLLPAVDG